MPTYRNDTTVTKRVVNIRGRKVSVPPGGSVKTYYDLHREGFTQTAATPYYNPIYSSHDITFTAENDNQTVLLNKDFTREVNIINFSDGLEIDVYLESASNSPPYFSSVGSNCSIFVKGLVGAIVLVPKGPGTCVLQQVKF